MDMPYFIDLNHHQNDIACHNFCIPIAYMNSLDINLSQDHYMPGQPTAKCNVTKPRILA